MGPLKINDSQIPPNEFGLPTFQPVVLAQQEHVSDRINCSDTLARSNESSEFYGSGHMPTDAASRLEEAISLSFPLQRDRCHHEGGEVS